MKYLVTKYQRRYDATLRRYLDETHVIEADNMSLHVSGTKQGAVLTFSRRSTLLDTTGPAWITVAAFGAGAWDSAYEVKDDKDDGV